MKVRDGTKFPIPNYYQLCLVTRLKCSSILNVYSTPQTKVAQSKATSVQDTVWKVIYKFSVPSFYQISVFPIATKQILDGNFSILYWMEKSTGGLQFESHLFNKNNLEF